ncbi:MAG: hypothetical protein FK731_09060 [Asgard group archaeon]|nr:hypothetical protein [Asgard group archaeon]
MSRLTFAIINCPKCDTSFDVWYNASINTLMNPELIAKLLNGELFCFECPTCKNKALLQTKILINNPKGMFWLDLELDHNSIINILRENEIIDDNNNVISVDFSIDELLEQHETEDETNIDKI